MVFQAMNYLHQDRPETDVSHSACETTFC